MGSVPEGRTDACDRGCRQGSRLMSSAPRPGPRAAVTALAAAFAAAGLLLAFGAPPLAAGLAVLAGAAAGGPRSTSRPGGRRVRP